MHYHKVAPKWRTSLITRHIRQKILKILLVEIAEKNTMIWGHREATIICRRTSHLTILPINHSIKCIQISKVPRLWTKITPTMLWTRLIIWFWMPILSIRPVKESVVKAKTISLEANNSSTIHTISNNNLVSSNIRITTRIMKHIRSIRIFLLNIILGKISNQIHISSIRMATQAIQDHNMMLVDIKNIESNHGKQVNKALANMATLTQRNQRNLWETDFRKEMNILVQRIIIPVRIKAHRGTIRISNINRDMW